MYLLRVFIILTLLFVTNEIIVFLSDPPVFIELNTPVIGTRVDLNSNILPPPHFPRLSLLTSTLVHSPSFKI